MTDINKDRIGLTGSDYLHRSAAFFLTMQYDNDGRLLLCVFVVWIFCFLRLKSGSMYQMLFSTCFSNEEKT